MSLKARGLVFVTFFGNCLVFGLLVASLTTEHWIKAEGKRHNSTDKSQGKIHFGLLSGQKSLNPGVGWRNETIDVISLIRSEPNWMNFFLWLGAALGIGLGIFSSALGAVASVLKSASAEKKRGTVIILIISNVCSAVSQFLAFICWLVQFYQHLTNNVFIAEDQKNWYSTDMAWLGHSFYFVVCGSIFACINVILIIVAISIEGRSRKVETPYDEKMQGAIMLY